ncbi:MAG: DUF3619 family protein [Burkholderiales bacterium]|nr:DUF3619 family protein [Burkholderiales bacterium]
MTTHSFDTQQDYEDTMGRAIVSKLGESANFLPHDITERLKVARMQALGKRKIVQTQVQTVAGVSVSGGVLAMHVGSGDHRLWNWVGSLLPLAALVAGLLAISLAQDGIVASEIAAVDTELLTTDLPPVAYTDPGFTQYLRVIQQGK